MYVSPQLEILNAFATTMLRIDDRTELVWHVVEEIIHLLAFEDCVIYRYDEMHDHLVQEAAFGEKQAPDRSIQDPVILPMGQGITGYVAVSKRSEIVEDTAEDPRYIVDMRAMRSEITVPILLNDQLYGVIDCEHSEAGFFTMDHLLFLETIAAMMASRFAHWVAIDEAKHANDLKSRFLTNLSHELRTPLNAIIGYSDAIQNDFFGVGIHAKYRDYAQDVMQSGQHLLHLIDEVLDLSAIEAGRKELHREACSVHDILEECRMMFRIILAQKDMQLETTIDEDIETIFVDRLAILQVVINLVSNAIKYSNEGTIVSIHVRQTEAHHIIVIRDQGQGIPKAELKNVLQRFNRGKINVLHQNDGMGIGLSIASGLVELHGGSFTIESEEGIGTDVFVSVPRD